MFVRCNLDAFVKLAKENEIEVVAWVQTCLSEGDCGHLVVLVRWLLSLLMLGDRIYRSPLSFLWRPGRNGKGPENRRV